MSSNPIFILEDTGQPRSSREAVKSGYKRLSKKLPSLAIPMLRHLFKFRPAPLPAEDERIRKPAISRPLYIPNCPGAEGQIRGLEWAASAKPQAVVPGVPGVPGVPTVSILWNIDARILGLHNQTPEDQEGPAVDAGSNSNNTYAHNYHPSYDASLQPGPYLNNGGHVVSIGSNSKGGQRGDPPDDRDGKKPPPKSPATRTSDPGDGRQFACPYQVYHRSFNSPRCPVFRRISDVRQHIDRKHRQPLYCPICGSTFADDAQRATHIRQINCQPANFPRHPGATREQWEDICRQGRIRTRRPDDERWYEIWDILFPGSERPPSTRTHSYVHDFLTMYRDTGRLQSFVESITAQDLQGEDRVQLQDYMRRLLAGMLDDMSAVAEHSPRSREPQSANTAQASCGNTPSLLEVEGAEEDDEYEHIGDDVEGDEEDDEMQDVH